MRKVRTKEELLEWFKNEKKHLVDYRNFKEDNISLTPELISKITIKEAKRFKFI